MIDMRHFLTMIVVLCGGLCATAQVNRVYINDFEIEPDSIVTVPLMLANEIPSRGVQFSITVPEGLKVAGFDMTDISLDLNMQLSHRQKAGTHTVFLYPMDRICFPSDTTAILTIDFKASHDFKGGVINLKKNRGSTLDNKSIVMDDESTTVTIPVSSLMRRASDGSSGEDLFFNIGDDSVVLDGSADLPL